MNLLAQTPPAYHAAAMTYMLARPGCRYDEALAAVTPRRAAGVKLRYERAAAADDDMCQMMIDGVRGVLELFADEPDERCRAMVEQLANVLAEFELQNAQPPADVRGSVAAF